MVSRGEPGQMSILGWVRYRKFDGMYAGSDPRDVQARLQHSHRDPSRFATAAAAAVELEHDRLQRDRKRWKHLHIKRGVVDVEHVARRMYIYKKDIEDPAIRPTPGCIGCHNLRLGKSAQSHTQECRDRIEAKLRETDQGRERLRRAEERISTAAAIRLQR